MFGAFTSFGKLGSLARAIAAAWTPSALWPTGTEPGMWIDPSNLASQWQDSTGTTPVATPGSVADSANPVGLALDIRAGATVLTDPGHHMLQSTSAARPLESARVNLLTYTEDFSHEAVTDGLTLSSAVTTGPFGDNDGWKFTETTSAYGHFTTSDLFYSFPAGQVLKRTGYFKQGSGGRNVQFGLTYGDDSFGGVIDLSTGTLVTGSTGVGTIVDSTVTLVNGWYECTVVGTMGASLTGAHPYDAMTNLTTYSDSVYTGDGTSFVYAFGRDLRPASVAPSVYPYQSVPGDGSTYDGNPAKFPYYLKYDGVDDGLNSASFAAGTLTSDMDCLIAVRRDAAGNAVCGLYESVAEANKVFGIAESGSGSGCVGSGAGTPTVWVDGAQLTGGTAVTRGTLHTALTVGDWHILELRGLDLSTWTAAGAGLYTSYVLNGAQGGILLFPSSTPTADRDAARTWLGAKVGLTL